MRKGTALFLYLLLFALPAAAQIPVALEGARVVEVEIAGAGAGYTPEREVGIPIGAPLTRQLMRSAITRLMAGGRWSDAQLDVVPVRGGVRLVAILTPRNLAARVEVLGNRVIADDELLRTMGVSAGDEIDGEKLVGMARQAQEAYAERGYQDAQATVSVRDTNDPARKVIVALIVEGPPTRVTAIHFSGDPPPRESGARSALKLSEGDPLDLRRVNDSVHAVEEEMRERGYLEAELEEAVVERVGEGAVITYPTHSGPRYTLRVRGQEPLARSDIEGVLLLGNDPITRPSVVLGIEERVRDLYQRHGFAEATVSVHRVQGRRPHTADLVIDVAHGQSLQVLAVTFPGAQHFETSFLRDQVVSYLQEDLPGSSILYPVDAEVVTSLGFGGRVLDGRRRRAIPRPLVVRPDAIYYEPTYEEAIEHIRELYQADGFLEPTVGPAALQRLPNGRALVVVPVSEGPRTMLQRVTLSGNDAIGAREILTAAALERDMPFSYLELERARISVLDVYREEGMLYARIEPHVTFSYDRTRAEVELEIVERFPVRVSEIVVRGASATSEDLIRDCVKLREGELYRPSLARETQDRLLELGVFAAVTVSPEEADLPAQRKRVIVTVTERPPQYLDLSAGLSTGQGVRGAFEYGYRNLFGYGIGLSLRAQLAFQFFFTDDQLRDRFQALTLAQRLEYRITTGITLPHIPGIPDLRTSLNAVILRDNERDFGLQKRGLVLAFNYRFNRNFTFVLSEDLENNDIQLFVDENLQDYLRNNTDPRLERLLRVPEGESTILATRLSGSLDFRDSPFTPTQGVYATTSFEFARTLQTEQTSTAPDGFFSEFLKGSISASGYVPIGDVVVAAQLRYGRIFHLTDDSQTYPNRRFFLGGVDTMRGYLQDALIPQDVADQIERDPNLTPNDVVRGGDTFVLARFEVRFPILGPLQGATFADVGNTWSNPDEIDLLEVRPTAGLGIRIATPAGPIAFDYGVLLLRRRYLNEPFGALHFSIGVF